MNLDLHIDLQASQATIAKAREAVADSKNCGGTNWGRHVGTLMAHTNILADQLERAHAALRSRHITGLQAANDDLSPPASVVLPA